jgi:NAD(P)-dependent dehydrogenase (short-subunit alcohol dehydrogenase family)
MQAERDLAGFVCVVTGASRGAGRGIAVELANRGAIAYVSGRRVDSASVDAHVSLDETVALARVALARANDGVCVRVR